MSNRIPEVAAIVPPGVAHVPPRPLRILYIVRASITVRCFMQDMIREAHRRGHTVEIAIGPEEPLPNVPVPFHLYPVRRAVLSPLALRKAVGGLREIIDRGDYDIIVPHMFLAGLLGRLAARLAGHPCVLFTCHALQCYPAKPPVQRAVIRAIERLSCQFTDAMSVSNRHDWRLLTEGHFMRRGRPIFKLASVGVDVPQIQRRAAAFDPASLRRELGLGPDLPIVCFLGRLIEEKGPTRFLEIARRCLQDGAKAYFLLAGSGPLEAWCKEFIQRHGLGEHVRALGWVRDAVEVMALSDVLCQPTENEGMPVAIQEAMAAGTVVVTSSVPGCEDVIEDGVDGRLIPLGDTDAWVAAVDALIRDEPHRRALSLAARHTAETRFDLRVCTPRWIDAIETAAAWCEYRRRVTQ